jgi:hypothetical protein
MAERSPSRRSGCSRRRGGGQICAQADLPARHPSAPGSSRQSTAEHLLSYIPQIDDGTFGNSERSKISSASHSGCAESPDGTAPLSRQIGWICKRIIAGRFLSAAYPAGFRKAASAAAACVISRMAQEIGNGRLFSQVRALCCRVSARDNAGNHSLGEVPSLVRRQLAMPANYDPTDREAAPAARPILDLLSRNAASYCPRPRFLSQAATSTVASTQRAGIIACTP